MHQHAAAGTALLAGVPVAGARTEVAAARSASSKTTTGAFPPSSRCTRFSVFGGALATARPLSTEPVNAIMSISGCSDSRAPTTGPEPVTMFSTPAGSRSATSSANFRVVSGVCSDGLITTVFPAARIGASFQAAISSG